MGFYRVCVRVDATAVVYVQAKSKREAKELALESDVANEDIELGDIVEAVDVYPIEDDTL